MLILVNARVYTLDAATPWAEAIAVVGSRLARSVRRQRSARSRRPRPGHRPEGRVRRPRIQRRARAHRQHRRAAASASTCSTCTSRTAFTDAHRDAAARLPKGSWITRGDWGAYEQWASRRAAGKHAASRARSGTRTVHAFARPHRSRHAGSSRLRPSLRSQHVPRELASRWSSPASPSHAHPSVARS